VPFAGGEDVGGAQRRTRYATSPARPRASACVRWSFTARALSPGCRPLVDARADCGADAPWIRHADGDGLSGRGDDKSALRQ
jgi:hypothetical protein